MRGGILSFSTNIEGLEMKKFKFKIHEIVFTNFIKMGNTKSMQNELR